MKPLSTAALLLSLSTALVAGALAPGPIAHARSVPGHWRPPVTSQVHVTIESADGLALPSAAHRGATFVAGERGDRYVIRVVNDGPDRLEVVVAVDGRDVITGRVGDFRRDRGYVVEPFGEVVIDGFRRSLDEVASFRFGGVRDSYTARRGTPQHAGVIGVAVFRERERPHGWAAPARKAAPSTSAPGADAGGSGRARSKDEHASRQQLGTEFGEDRFSPVVEVPFVRRDHDRPDQRVRVFYDSAAALRRRGVAIDAWRDDDRFTPDPEPWPAARDDGRFTPPPPGPRRWQ